MKIKSLILSLAAIAGIRGMAFAQSFLVDPSNPSNHTIDVTPGGFIGIGMAPHALPDRQRIEIDGNVRVNGPFPWFGLQSNEWSDFAFIQANLNVNGTGSGDYFGIVTPRDKGFLFFQSQIGAKMVIAPNGNVGIGTTNAPERLTVVGGHLSVQSSTATDGYIALRKGGADYPGYIDFYKNGPTRIAYLGYDYPGSPNLGLYLQPETGANFVINGGKVGIGTTNPSYTLDVQTDSSVKFAYSRFNTTDGTSIMQLISGCDFRGASAHAGIRNGSKIIANGPGPLVIEHADPQPIIFGTLDVERARIESNGNVGIGTLSPQAKLDVAGTIKCQVVDLSGADLAEKFDVAGEFVPGMVVCPDPENEGKLHVCAREYDRSAIGVLSGAGGINTGLVLHQPGTAADGEQPVAMTGRVYVWADASLGAIKPGDELTSSATRGHAMKATDDTRANRAVLGTALTSLKQGRGLVLTALQRR